MKLSTKGRYGLRAMLDLAEYGTCGAVSTASIAQRQKLSESYLEQLIRKLRDAGLVRSVRGKSGGYLLAKDAKEITVGEVLRALEGDLLTVECTGEDGTCSQADQCISRIMWQKINDAIKNTVDTVRLYDLLSEAGRKTDENRHLS